MSNMTPLHIRKCQKNLIVKSVVGDRYETENSWPFQRHLTRIYLTWVVPQIKLYVVNGG